jgi:gamma-glutamylputrescine oxidase
MSVSHWQARTTRTSFPHGPVPAEADVVVVGGGLAGVCCAHWLGRRGRSVLLLERDTIAAGATGRNAGFVVPTTALPYPDAVRRYGPDAARTLRNLAVEGTRLLTTLSAGVRSADSIHLALTEDQAARAIEDVRLSRADGFDMSWVDRPFPGPRILGGAVVPGALADSVAVTDEIAASAGEHGAIIRTGVRVDAIRPGVHLETSAGRIRAAAAVVATNAWLPVLVPRLGIRPVQGQMLATEPMPPVLPAGMSAPITDGGEYWQQTPDGTIVLGGCRTVTAPPGDPVAQVPQPEVHEALLGVLPGLFPELFGESRPIRSVRSWAGAMAFTNDGLPIADRVGESIWALGGFNGHGMSYGAILARLVADWVDTGERPPDLALLAADRPALAKAA